MRSTLEESSNETWRQMEERKRLNASFSHDLRTPLTVLEGHLDILQKYSENGALSEEDISEIYSVMDIQLKRLIRYVASMSKLQSLEDIPLSPKLTDTQELLKTIKNTADIICAGIKMHFVSDIHEPDVAVDIEIVLQVFENLMSDDLFFVDKAIRDEEARILEYRKLAVSSDHKKEDYKLAIKDSSGRIESLKIQREKIVRQLSCNDAAKKRWKELINTYWKTEPLWILITTLLFGV